MNDPVVLAIVVIGAVLVVAALLFARRTRAGDKRSGALHTMESEKSIQIFGDRTGTPREPGVREEDRTARWGDDSGR